MVVVEEDASAISSEDAEMQRCREHSSCSFKDRMTLKIQCCNLLSKGVMSGNTAVYPLPPCHYPKPNAFPKIPHDTNNKPMKQQTHIKISAVNGYCLSHVFLKKMAS
jgi:hypothetical protein